MTDKSPIGPRQGSFLKNDRGRLRRRSDTILDRYRIYGISELLQCPALSHRALPGGLAAPMSGVEAPPGRRGRMASDHEHHPDRAASRIMARLRDPEGGCPWDLAQSHASIVPYTIEEAYEVAEAVETGDPEELRDELGDLLFQVVFQARIAEEAGTFGFDEVATAIADKMVRRHPHIFGDAKDLDPAAVNAQWAAIKAEERRAKAARAAASGRPPARRAFSTACPWRCPPSPGPKRSRARRRPSASTGRTRRRSSPRCGRRPTRSCRRWPARARRRCRGDRRPPVLGRNNLARHAGVDPEEALRRANLKFQRRFAAMEAEVTKDGRPLAGAGLATMEEAWVAVKRRERKPTLIRERRAIGLTADRIWENLSFMRDDLTPEPVPTRARARRGRGDRPAAGGPARVLAPGARPLPRRPRHRERHQPPHPVAAGAGRDQPTASLLGRLCTVYGRRCRGCSPRSRRPTRGGRAPRRAGGLGRSRDGFRRRGVSPPARDFSVELVHGTLPAGASIAYAAPPVGGLEHHLWMLGGRLDLALDGVVHALCPAIACATASPAPPASPARARTRPAT